MSCEIFWCIVITAGGGAALMFAVKVTKNFKKKFSKKFFFALKNIFKSFQHRKVKKNCGSNRPSDFCASQISLFCYNLEMSVS